MVDLAVRLDQPEEVQDQLIDEAWGIAARYEALWDVLHAEPTFSFDDRYQIEGQIRRLHDLGFAVDEVKLEATGDEAYRLKVAVAARRFHAVQLHDLTGLDVGEGQARILLGDLRAYQASRSAALSDAESAQRWVQEVFRPGAAQAHAAAGGLGDPIQAYCDLLEVRWLLSEQAGHDVGDLAALDALSHRTVPPQSAARMAVAEATTGQIPALDAAMVAQLTADD